MQDFFNVSAQNRLFYRESIYYRDEMIMHNCIVDNVFTIILDGLGVLDYKEHCRNYVVDNDNYNNSANDYVSARYSSVMRGVFDNSVQK